MDTSVDLKMICSGCLSPRGFPVPPPLAALYLTCVGAPPRPPGPLAGSQLALCTLCAHLTRRYTSFRDQCRRVRTLLMRLERDQLSYSDITTSMMRSLGLKPGLAISHNETDKYSLSIEYAENPYKTPSKEAVEMSTNNLVEINNADCEVKELTDIKSEAEPEVEEEAVIEYLDDHFDPIDEEPLKWTPRPKAAPRIIRKTQDLFVDKFLKKTLNLEEQMNYFLKRKQSRKYQKSKLKCDICYRGFSDLDSFKMHSLLHSDENGGFACAVCMCRYPDESKLRRHMLRHRYLYLCKMCPFQTQHWQVLTDHLKKHQGKLFTCQHCGNVYKNRSTYLNHSRVRHGSQDASCPQCGVSCATTLGLRRHCDSAHGQHVPEIPEDGPRCMDCVKSIQFVDEVALKKHQQLTHNKQVARIKTSPGFNCDLCCKQYRSQTEYDSHFSECHPDEAVPKKNRNKVLCEECGKMFQCKALLLIHKQSHNAAGTGKYRCDECGRSFTTKTTLGYHRMNHKGASFKCNLCDKKFSHPSNRLRHVKYYHNESRDKSCSYCDKRFKSASCLRTHVDHVHRLIPWKKRQRTSNTNNTANSNTKCLFAN